MPRATTPRGRVMATAMAMAMATAVAVEVAVAVAVVAAKAMRMMVFRMRHCLPPSPEILKNGGSRPLHAHRKRHARYWNKFHRESRTSAAATVRARGKGVSGTMGRRVVLLVQDLGHRRSGRVRGPSAGTQAPFSVVRPGAAADV